MSMLIDPSLIDVQFEEHDGYPKEFAFDDTRDQLMSAAQDAGAIVTSFPSHLWIDPKDWADKERDNDKYHLWADDFLDRFTNQGQGNGGYSTHECTCHSLVKLAESCRNRHRNMVIGPPVPGKRLELSAQSSSVWFSCLSVYAEANSGQWGGANVRQVLRIAAQRGFLPDIIQPRPYKFEHALHGTCGAGGINQSRGKWTPLSQFPAGWKETAKHFRPREYCFPETWEQTVCLILHGYGVGVGRDGHAVPLMRWNDAQKVSRYPDSYDVYRYDSISRIKASVGGSFAIMSMTVSDKWDNPAGVLATAL